MRKNLWLWTVALHYCYEAVILNLTQMQEVDKRDQPKGTTKQRELWNRQKQWRRDVIKTEKHFCSFFSFFFWLASKPQKHVQLANMPWKLPCWGWVENLSRHSWFSFWTRAICRNVIPIDKTQSNPLAVLYKNLTCRVENI